MSKYQCVFSQKTNLLSLENDFENEAEKSFKNDVVLKSKVFTTSRNSYIPGLD